MAVRKLLVIAACLGAFAAWGASGGASGGVGGGKAVAASSGSCAAGGKVMPSWPDMRALEAGSVQEIDQEDGTLTLSSGQKVLLSGLLWTAHPDGPPVDRLPGAVPDMAMSGGWLDPGIAGWQGRAQARAGDLVLGKRVALFGGQQGPDRYGRLMAQVRIVEDDRWLQGALLSEGLARLRVRPGEEGPWDCMRELEEQARKAGHGLWQDPRYRVLQIDQGGNPEVSRPGQGFRIIEGRILAAEAARGRVWLNFGPDWRRDFTLSADRQAMRRFEKAGLPLESLQGHRVRARGWLRFVNGPMIDLEQPEQLEDLGP